MTGRLFLALVAALAIRPASATTVVAFYTREAIFLGADSKSVGSHGQVIFNCKINVKRRIVWASAGLPVEPQAASWPGMSIRIPDGAIDRATSFRDALRTLTSDAARQLPLARRVGLEEGLPSRTLHIDLAVAGMEDGTARLTIIGLGRRYFGHSDYAPIECRPGGGPGCGDGYLFRMGYVAAINAILEQPSGSALVARLAPDGAIRYLISAEERARPQFVGGPISILRLDHSGIRWIDPGLCH